MSVHKAAVKGVVQDFSLELHFTDRSEITEEFVLEQVRRTNY
jgi:hypothetical protein